MTDEKEQQDKLPESEERKPQEQPSGQASEELTSETQAEQQSELETLRAKLAESEKMVELYKDQFLRKAAEFENYKKRTENDYLKLAKYASEDIITELLPILDDIARSLKVGKERREFGPFYKGVELIYSKMMKVLEAQGLKAIDAVGKEFNVDYHEALMQMPKENVPPNTVIEEVEKGYMLHDKVIRHSKVIVSAENEVQVGNTSETKDDAQKKENQ